MSDTIAPDRVAALRQLDREITDLNTLIIEKRIEALKQYVPLLVDEVLSWDRTLEMASDYSELLRRYFNGRLPLVLSREGWGIYFSQVKHRTDSEQFLELFLELFNEELVNRSIPYRVYADPDWTDAGVEGLGNDVGSLGDESWPR